MLERADGAALDAAGFREVRIETACAVNRNGRDHPIVLATAAR